MYFKGYASAAKICNWKTVWKFNGNSNEDLINTDWKIFYSLRYTAVVQCLSSQKLLAVDFYIFLPIYDYNTFLWGGRNAVWLVHVSLAPNFKILSLFPLLVPSRKAENCPFTVSQLWPTEKDVIAEIDCLGLTVSLETELSASV